MDRMENAEEMNHLNFKLMQNYAWTETDPWASHGVHLLIILSE